MALFIYFSVLIKSTYKNPITKINETQTPMRESIPKKVDKKSRVPKEEKGVQGPQGGKEKHFCLPRFVLVNITITLAQGYVSP